MINVRITPAGKFVFTGNIEKDPNDVVDLIVDYTQYFKTDNITTAVAVGTDVTIDSVSETDNIVTVFISGGTTTDVFNGREIVGAKVKITVSSPTRTLERTIIVHIKEL